jgi:type IV secretory pathway protease TraF
MLVGPLVGAALTFVAIFGAPDAILYNPSNSIPRGFYLRSDESATRGSIVTVRASEVAPAYAAARHFTDAGDRFIKRVAATRGQVVCATGAVITIDGAVAAQRIERDSAGRALPTWDGCRTLAADEVFLLGDTADSFDGRYWGPISVRLIEGVWRRSPRRAD